MNFLMKQAFNFFIPKLKELSGAIDSIAATNNVPDATIIIHNWLNPETGLKEPMLKFMGISAEGELIELFDAKGNPQVFNIEKLPELLMGADQDAE
jgi:hypothetical protein